MKRPLIDPREQIERAIGEAEGIVTPRMLADLLARLERFGDAPEQRVILQETLTWYRANVGASGDAAYLMRVPFPSSDSAWAMATSPYVLPAAGRVLIGRLWNSEAVTAGTVTLRLRVIEGSDTNDYDLSDVQLSTTAGYTRHATSFYPWETALQIAKGATVEARAVTASSMTPTTMDVSASVVIGYDVD